MNGEWLRVTPAELAAALAYPGDAYGLVTAADETGDIEAIAGNRRSGTDKTWHALAYLLERADFPIDIITGEQSLVDDPDDSDVDWGYGPPGYLTPDQVRRAADALSEVTADGLVA